MGDARKVDLLPLGELSSIPHHIERGYTMGFIFRTVQKDGYIRYDGREWGTDGDPTQLIGHRFAFSTYKDTPDALGLWGTEELFRFAGLYDKDMEERDLALIMKDGHLVAPWWWAVSYKVEVVPGKEGLINDLHDLIDKMGES